MYETYENVLYDILILHKGLQKKIIICCNAVQKKYFSDYFILINLFPSTPTKNNSILCESKALAGFSN